MPHQCVRCNEFYQDGAKELLNGCPCGAKLFFFIKQEKLDKARGLLVEELKPEQKKQIEKDVLELVGSENEDTPVILDFESIRVSKPGKYELDLVQLFQKNPLIFKLEEGKYVIDIGESFERLRKKGK